MENTTLENDLEATTDLCTFDVQVYGNLEKISDVISKARVRIFYRGLNRNRTYISDEFAQKLINTLPYSPVKGIFNADDVDFSDHGDKRNEGRAYGVIPNPANFAWEKHVDEDGVEREYACADVYLWTGIYEEAKLIPGKSQSMELHQKTLKGEWRVIEGKKCFFYLDGNFLGLQVLGNDVEPCFEGSAFYSLFTSVQQLLNEVKNLKSDYSKLKFEKDKEETPMVKVNFKLSDNEKYNALWSLLNTEIDQDGNPLISYVICDVYDEYALAFNLETAGYEKVYYSKDDSSDSVKIDNKVATYFVEVSEDEQKILEFLRQEANQTNSDSFVERFNSIPTLEDTVSQNNETIANLQTSLNTLTEEHNQLKAELEGLQTYKKNIETSQKNEIIDKYSVKLEPDVIEKFKNAIDSFSVTDLEKELSFELVQAEPGIFSKQTAPIPKPDFADNDIGDILAKYKKN